MGGGCTGAPGGVRGYMSRYQVLAIGGSGTGGAWGRRGGFWGARGVGRVRRTRVGGTVPGTRVRRPRKGQGLGV